MGFLCVLKNIIMSTKARVIVISHTSRTHNTYTYTYYIHISISTFFFFSATFFLYLVYYDSDFVRFMHFSMCLCLLLFFFMSFSFFFFSCLSSIRESWLCSIYCKALTSKLNVSIISVQSSTTEETYTKEHEHIEYSDIDIDEKKKTYKYLWNCTATDWLKVKYYIRLLCFLLCLNWNERWTQRAKRTIQCVERARRIKPKTNYCVGCGLWGVCTVRTFV